MRPCATAYFDFGHDLAQLLAHFVEIGDPRHDIEDLPAAVALAHDRFADRHRVVGHHKGAHRQAVDRRRGDDAHLAHPGQRQLQGARDRRRGHRQHMDVGLELLQLLLLRDAEMLLLVDDQEAEMGELDVFCEQRMRPDDDVEQAFGELLLDRPRVLGGDQPRQLADPQWQAGEALGEVAVMLAGEQGSSARPPRPGSRPSPR